jgi:hypothetical protein
MIMFKETGWEQRRRDDAVTCAGYYFTINGSLTPQHFALLAAPNQPQ